MMQVASRLNHHLYRNVVRTTVSNVQQANACLVINRFKTTNGKDTQKLNSKISRNAQQQQEALKLDPNKKYECPPSIKPNSSTSSNKTNSNPSKPPLTANIIRTFKNPPKYNSSKSPLNSLLSNSSSSKISGPSPLNPLVSGGSGGSGSKNSSSSNDSGYKQIGIVIGTVAGIAGLIFLYKSQSKDDSKPTEKDSIQKASKNDKSKFRVPADSKNIPKHVPYVLIGGGTASFAAFRAIKSNEPRAKIVVISDEELMSYMRPPLSKEIWFDTQLGVTEARFKQWNGAERSLYYEPDEFYMPVEKLEEAKNGGVSVIRGYKAVKLNVNEQKVLLDDGTEITFDKCLIATGSKPKTLDVFDRAPAKVKERIFTYKTIKDFENLKERVEKAQNIAIVGNGFLGSELSCALSHYGQNKNLKVYQLFPEDGNMAKVLPSYLSSWTTKRIRDVGVDVMPQSQIISTESFEGNKVKLVLNNGKNIIVDFVIQAIGSEPNIELAKDAMLEIDKNLGGFVVNAELEARTNVYAAGDVACFYDPRLGRRRVEHHDHAVVSGRLAGENMVGKKKPYKHQSMFWSDLGSAVGFEAIGLVDSSIPTVAVFAKQTELDKKEHHLALNDAGKEEVGEEKKKAISPKVTFSENDDEKDCTPVPDNFDKGVLFYIQDKKIVGILLWNVFNRISIARKILSSDETFTDLNEVAKLFDIFDQHHDKYDEKKK